MLYGQAPESRHFGPAVRRIFGIARVERGLPLLFDNDQGSFHGEHSVRVDTRVLCWSSWISDRRGRKSELLCFILIFL